MTVAAILPSFTYWTPKTTTVNGCQNDIFLLAGLLDGRVSAFRRRLVNRVHDVDIGMSGEKVLHGRLALIQRPVRILLSNNRRIAFLDAETLKESIMSLLIYRCHLAFRRALRASVPYPRVPFLHIGP